MRKILLADGTKITKCLDSTTPTAMFVVRDTYADAAAVMDLFNDENTKVIKVLDENDEVIEAGTNLVFEHGCAIQDMGTGKRITIITRPKTDMEIMRDEIQELQEAIIDI